MTKFQGPIDLKVALKTSFMAENMFSTKIFFGVSVVLS